MVIAALVSFGILLVAWILAPEQPTATVQEVPLAETQPLAA
jgi:hypothetical protein